MSRTWAELLGDAEAAGEQEEEERTGFLGRLRDSLGKSRRALTEQIAAAAFDPSDDEAWERLEEALIAGDVGVRATAELVRRLEARGEIPDLNGALAEEIAQLLGEPPTLSLTEKPSVVLVVGVNGTGKTTTIGKLAQKLREHRRSVLARRRRHVPRRRRGAARDLGRARGGGLRRRRARRRPRRGRLRRDRGARRAGTTSRSSTPPAGCTRRRT